MQPLPPIGMAHASAAKSPAPVTPAKAGYVRTGKDWFALITVSAIAILLCLIIYRVIVPSDSTMRDRAVGTALLGCQQAIRSTAQYGDADMPPYVKNTGSGDEFHFDWQRGSFEFSNGFGAREKMSASCMGVMSTGQIKRLTVNSKEIL